MTPREVYEKAKQVHRKAMADHDEVYVRAGNIQTKALAELRTNHDKERAVIFDSWSEATEPSRKVFHDAARRMNEAREAFHNSPEQIEYKTHRKRVESRMTKLYFIASFLFYCAWSAFGRAFSFVSYNDLITKPIPVLLFFGGYVVGVRWLRKYSHVRILRGSLFRKVDNKEVDPK